MPIYVFKCYRSLGKHIFIFNNNSKVLFILRNHVKIFEFAKLITNKSVVCFYTRIHDELSSVTNLYLITTFKKMPGLFCL